MKIVHIRQGLTDVAPVMFRCRMWSASAAEIGVLYITSALVIRLDSSLKKSFIAYTLTCTIPSFLGL
jgi:hypothetical protein